ncbi:zinc-ribbon domain-containing protein [Thaumasiovibrio subtropicus]|uniref:zinc-ribbon domain-containing protein n=1 Tax=Thaumasiovibrio subtropicus TaxID=1891207 RepID=UPI000B35588F|nr:zinc-ribbon domain-containing protein [Thaumasiovibrio subtropicus]
MKSGKQRRVEIKERRRAKAKLNKGINRFDLRCKPANAVMANLEALQHNARAAYTSMPLFYVDRPFTCKDCGSHELWTAKQQKWWYEIAKGSIDSIAIRCRRCRKKEQLRKSEARRVHLEGVAKKTALKG